MSPSINITPRGKLTSESFEQITICTSFVWIEYSLKMFANLTEYSFICMTLIAQPQYAYGKKISLSIIAKMWALSSSASTYASCWKGKFWNITFNIIIETYAWNEFRCRREVREHRGMVLMVVVIAWTLQGCK